MGTGKGPCEGFFIPSFDARNFLTLREIQGTVIDRFLSYDPN